MTLSEAKLNFAQSVANLINESHLPPTICRIVLADIDRTLAELEEQQFQKAQEVTENA